MTKVQVQELFVFSLIEWLQDVRYSVPLISLLWSLMSDIYCAKFAYCALVVMCPPAVSPTGFCPCPGLPPRIYPWWTGLIPVPEPFQVDLNLGQESELKSNLFLREDEETGSRNFLVKEESMMLTFQSAFECPQRSHM